MKTKKIRIPLSDLLRGADEKIAKLEAQNESLKTRESDMLLAFSRIIRNVDTEDSGSFYSKRPSRRYETWMEVAADIGKLLAKDSYSDLKNTISEKDSELANMHSEIKNLKMQLDLKNF